MPERDQAVYVISVAAELAGVHPQTLRVYERKGLIEPDRTEGNTRRYSVDDIERLQRIQGLTQGEGVNLAGVRMILELEEQLGRMRSHLEEMADRMATLEEDAARQMRDMAREATEILPVSAHKTIEQLLAEMHRKGRPPIPMGPGTSSGGHRSDGASGAFA